MVDVYSGTQFIQLLGLLFGLLMLYFTFLHYKRNEFKIETFLFWALLWVVYILMVIYPTSLDFFVEQLKFGRRLDFFVVFGFLFIVALVYYNYLSIHKTKRRMEIMTRKIALSNCVYVDNNPSINKINNKQSSKKKK